MAKVVLVTGPAGSGKSTTCESFAQTATGVWALVSQDHVRSFVKSGYAFADESWTTETDRQWDVSIAICCAIAHQYVAADLNCIIDLFAPPLGFHEKWQPALGGIEYTFVVLLPDLAAVLARNAHRSGHARLDDSQAREHHEWFEEWRREGVPIIDSSTHSIDAVVTKLIDIVESQHGEPL